MQIALKCWTPEHYDCVTHAVIPFCDQLVDDLLRKMALANRLRLELWQAGDRDFMGLEFDRNDPYFIDSATVLGAPFCATDAETLGMKEEDFDELSDGGFSILPAKMDETEWEEVSIRPCMLMVMAGDLVEEAVKDNGRIYWYGYDKHGDAGCRAETYSLYAKDLQEIKEALKECAGSIRSGTLKGT